MNAILISVEETYGGGEHIGRGKLLWYFPLNLKSYPKQLNFGVRQIPINTFLNSFETAVARFISPVRPHIPEIKGITILWKLNTIILK